MRLTFEEGSSPLACAWMTTLTTYGQASLVRMTCANDEYMAFDAIQRGRQHCPSMDCIASTSSARQIS